MIPFLFLPVKAARWWAIGVTVILMVLLGIGRAKVGHTPLVSTVLSTLAIAAAAGIVGVLIGWGLDSTLQPDSLPSVERPDRQERILSAVIDIIGRDGLAGVSVRSVAREAGVAHGLVNYYFEDKKGLIEAALRHVEAEDLELLEPDSALAPAAQLRRVLRSIVQPEFLTTEYLALRLQLWALAQADEEFARINATAQRRYRERLSRLIEQGVPGTSRTEARQRAADIDIIQNGIWLTALLRIDRASLARAVARCEDIAFTGA